MPCRTASRLTFGSRGHPQEPRRWSVIKAEVVAVANKKGAARRSAGGRDSPPQTGRTAQELSESYNRFFRVWSGRSQDMGNQVSQNLKKQQAMYDDFFGRWNKLSAEVGSRLSRWRANEGVREFYDVWKTYASKMGPRLQKAVTEGLQGYDTVTHSLDKYTRKMKERAQGLLAKPEEPRSLDDLYGAWQEFGTSVRKQMQGAMGQGLVEADELTRTWLDFSSRMDKLVSDVGCERNGQGHGRSPEDLERLLLQGRAGDGAARQRRRYELPAALHSFLRAAKRGVEQPRAVVADRGRNDEKAARRHGAQTIGRGRPRIRGFGSPRDSSPPRDLAIWDAAGLPNESLVGTTCMGGAWLRGREKDGNAVDRHGNDSNENEDETNDHRNHADEHEDDNGFPTATSSKWTA